MTRVDDGGYEVGDRRQESRLKRYYEFTIVNVAIAKVAIARSRVAIAEGDVEYYGNKCHSFASMMMVIAANISNPEPVRVTSMEWLCHYAACHAWSNEVAS